MRIETGNAYDQTDTQENSMNPMNPTLMSSIRTLLAEQGRPDRDALVKVFADPHASNVLACLAPPGSLVQIAAALRIGYSWCCAGWKRHTDDLVDLITDPRCPSPRRMIETWSRIPSAVGVLRNRIDGLIAWERRRLDRWMDNDLATLLGPSDEAARLLIRSVSSTGIGRTLRRWSMGVDPNDPTAWQAMIDPDLRAVLRENADVSQAFPAWGGDDAVTPDDVLAAIVNDLIDGWSPDHPSIRGRIGWLEHHVPSTSSLSDLALVASIGDSDVLADTVCTRIVHTPSSVPWVAEGVPWSRLHPRIQTVIDEIMRRSSDRWARTWACALGQVPLVPDNDINDINESLLLWRIDLERWEALDAALRADLVSHTTLFLGHCFGWGMHPDLVAGKFCPNGRYVRFWNPDVPPGDLLAWDYAGLLSAQRTIREAWSLFILLPVLPPDRRARFEQIISWRLGS